MKCEYIKEMLIKEGTESLPQDALAHIRHCSHCQHMFGILQRQECIFNRKSMPESNFYFTEKTMAAITNRQASPLIGHLKAAMVTIVFVSFIISGITVYMSYTSTHKPQYDLLSLNDNNIQTFALDNE